MGRNGWSHVRIDSFGDVIGGRQRSHRITNGSMRPYLRVANVFDGFINSSNVLEMPFTDEEFAIYQLRSGDVLLNEGQSLELVGRSAVYRGDPPNCCFQNTLIRFRPHRDDDSDFAHYLFEYLRTSGSLASISSRTTSIAHLGMNRFAALRISLPPLEIRDEIAAVLRVWDSAIDCLSKLLRARRRLRMAVAQQLLTGRRRFPEFRGRVWQRRPIGDLLTEANRTVKLNDDQSYRLVSIRRRSGGFFDREIRLGRDIGYAKLKSVATGDFVIARRQVVHGAMATVTAAFDGAFVSDAYATLVPRNTSDIHMPFFDHMSRTPLLYNMAMRCSYGVAVEKLFFNLRWFMAEEILIPATLHEQQRIASVLDLADREVHLLERKLDGLREQKKGLLVQLLTGKVRLKEVTK